MWGHDCSVCRLDTYIVVLSSILVQGLSIGKLVKHVTKDEPVPEAHH